MGNKEIGQSHARELHLWDCPFVRGLEMDRDFTKEVVCSLEQVQGRPCFFCPYGIDTDVPGIKKRTRP